MLRVGRAGNEFEIQELNVAGGGADGAAAAASASRPMPHHGLQLRGQPARHIESGGALAKSIAFSAVGDVALGGFSECTGLEMSLKMEEYKEGGRNGEVLQFPDAQRVGTDHAEEGRRSAHGALGLALRLRRRARASGATA